jgi:hypothetical protein
MSTYRMSDGTVVRTENAKASWDEETWHDGSNMISRATGSQWRHETLYKSRRGRYWVEHISNYQGSVDRAEWISNEEAARWLIHQDYELPDDLKALESEVSE